MSKVPCGGFEFDESLTLNDGKLGLAPGAGGGGLPSGGAPYQQLVTDGDGNTVWEDRLAYETDPVLTELVPEETVTFTLNSGVMSAFWPSTFNAVEGQTYIVKFDGADYTCTCVRLGSETGPLAIGNLSLLKLGDDTGEPFVMMYQGRWAIMSLDSATEHTISIHYLGTTISKIDEKFLPVASDETYGVVKKSEIVTPYVFGGEVPHDKMVEAVTAFKNGTASITWGLYKVADAWYDSSTDEVFIRYADEPNVLHSYKNNNGKYIFNVGGAAYDELDTQTLRIRNSDDQSAYSIITSSGTVGDNMTISLTAAHLSLNSKEILNEKELILRSSTADSTKRFRITVDDNGAISATEVTT